MKTLHVELLPVKTSDGCTIFSAKFSGPDFEDRLIHITLPESAMSRHPSRGDHFALAALFPAMLSFDQCIIHSPVSRSVLENLSELNAIWQTWRPEKYRPVEWAADHVINTPSDRSSPTGAVLAFSGGVDASATLRRHTREGLAWRRRHIKSAVLVHGFDIPLSSTHGFYRACARAERITSAAGVPLIPVRTNLRELPGHWEDTFAVNLSCVLHLFNETFQNAIMASCQPYAAPKLPWGSNPISNPWLGTTEFPVRTDGAELTRMQKVELIAQWPAALENVRVCWEGDAPGDNCGACEKCVRTQLELAACGVSPNGNFRVPLQPGMVLNVHPKNQSQLSCLEEILDYAGQNKLSAWWTEELQRTIHRTRKSGFHPGGRRPNRLKRLTRKVIRAFSK